MSTALNPIFKAFCILLVLVSVTCLSWRVHSGFYDKPVDFLLFAASGKHFHDSGELYKRSDNLADSYHPSAAIYKFPPAFQLTIAPWYQADKTFNLHTPVKLLMLACYIASLWLLFNSLRRRYTLVSGDAFKLFTFITVAGCWLMPFFESIRWL